MKEETAQKAGNLSALASRLPPHIRDISQLIALILPLPPGQL